MNNNAPPNTFIHSALYVPGKKVNTKYTINDEGVFDYNFTDARVGSSDVSGFRDFDGEQKDIVFLGAAQTAGRFVHDAFPQLVEANSEYSVANFGWGGVGDWQYNRPEFIDYINNSKCCVYQITSGRSTKNFNKTFGIEKGAGVASRLADKGYAGIFFNDLPRFAKLFKKNKKEYLKNAKDLIEKIKVPIIFVYVSAAEQHQVSELVLRQKLKGQERDSQLGLDLLWKFPQLVSKEMVEEVSENNIIGYFKQPLTHRLPGPVKEQAPTAERDWDKDIMNTDDYYPDQGTHYDIAEWLIPQINRLLYTERSVEFRMGDWYNKEFMLNEFDWKDIEKKNFVSRTINHRWRQWIKRFKTLGIAEKNPGIILDSQDHFLRDLFINDSNRYNCSLGDRAEIPIATHNRKEDCRGSILFPIDDTYNVMTGKDTEEDRYSWGYKKNEVVWRGKLTGKDSDITSLEICDGIEDRLSEFHRFNAVKMWCKTYNIKFVEEYSALQIIADRPGAPKWAKRCLADPKIKKNIAYVKEHLESNDMIAPHMDFYEEMLQYKYILSLDGNDWSSSIPWILKSNSLMLSPVPKWHNVLNFGLKPWVHYVPLENDISDLGNKIKWCLVNQRRCKAIVRNASAYISQFNAEEEKKIEKRIFEKLNENAYVLTASSRKKYNSSMEYIKQQEETDISYVKIGNGSKKLIVSFSADDKNKFEGTKRFMRLKHEHMNFDVLYLRNPHNWYLGKLNGIGATMEETLKFLEKEFSEYDEVLCTGASSGGYASLLFGSILRVDNVIAFHPQTDLQYAIDNLPKKNINAINLRKLAEAEPGRWDMYKDILNVLKKKCTLNTDIRVIPWNTESRGKPADKILHCESHWDRIAYFYTVDVGRDKGNIFQEFINR